jgi:hypothetical protein
MKGNQNAKPGGAFGLASLRDLNEYLLKTAVLSQQISVHENRRSSFRQLRKELASHICAKKWFSERATRSQGARGEI